MRCRWAWARAACRPQRIEPGLRPLHENFSSINISKAGRLQLDEQVLPEGDNMRLPSTPEMTSPPDKILRAAQLVRRKVGAFGEGLADGSKFLLTRIGEHCSRVHIHRINSTANYLELGRWFRHVGFQIPPRFNGGCESSRHHLFNLMAAELGDRKVLYLEYGVWKGESIRYWAGLLKNPGSMLHGFDSFEGFQRNSTLPLESSLFRPTVWFHCRGQFLKRNRSCPTCVFIGSSRLYTSA